MRNRIVAPILGMIRERETAELLQNLTACTCPVLMSNRLLRAFSAYPLVGVAEGTPLLDLQAALFTVAIKAGRSPGAASFIFGGGSVLTGSCWH